MPKGNIKISGPNGKIKECNLKRSKSVNVCDGEDPHSTEFKRNPRVKYVKADIFKKHEKLRNEQFEQKICELISCNINNPSNTQIGNGKENKDSNLQRNLLENSNGIDSLDEDSEPEEPPMKHNDFIIAQNYGSFDEEDNLDSVYSSMKGDSLPGDFDLEVVGNKIEIPKPSTEQQFKEDTNKPNNASLLGSKITFGEPSGDVFGLTFDNGCDGIFGDAADNEFLPINTIQNDN